MFSRESGASAVEYALMLAFIAMAMIAVVVIIGQQTCESMVATGDEFSDAAPAISPPGDC